jgi:hypothetical protein
VGDEIDAMTDNILSTLFSSREREFVGKEITKKRENVRCEIFNVVFICTLMQI